MCQKASARYFLNIQKQLDILEYCDKFRHNLNVSKYQKWKSEFLTIWILPKNYWNIFVCFSDHLNFVGHSSYILDSQKMWE